MSENIIIGSSNAYECPVYLTDLKDDAHVLQCGHSYSSQVIEDIAKGAIKNCPVCVKPITEKSYPNYSLNDAIRENSELKKEITILTQENLELKEENRQYHITLEKISYAFEHMCEKYDILDKEFTEIKKENSRVQIQNIIDRKIYEDLSKKFDDDNSALKKQMDEEKSSFNDQIAKSEAKYEDLSKKLETDTASLKAETTNLKAQIEANSKPVYYYSSDSSDSESESEDEAPVKKSQKQIVVSNPPLVKVGVFIADVLSCKHLSRILNGIGNK